MGWWGGGLVGWWVGGVDWWMGWIGGLVWTGGLVDWWSGSLQLGAWRLCKSVLARATAMGRRMTGSASQAMDVVFRMLLGEKILGRGSRGREGLGIRPRPEAGGFLERLVSGGMSRVRGQTHRGETFVFEK